MLHADIGHFAVIYRFRFAGGDAHGELLHGRYQLLEIRGGAIAAMTKYLKPLGPALFADFGLPLTCE